MHPPIRFLIVFAAIAVVVAVSARGQSQFGRDVYPIFERAGCQGCHNANGVAAATRLQFPEPGAPSEEIEAFAASLEPLLDRSRPEESLLLKKPTARIPHTGGVRIKPGSAEEAALRAWIESATPAAEPRAVAAHAVELRAAVLRRVTHSQYDNAVRDLLGDASGPARGFPPEDFVDGFKNQYQAASISPLQAEAYNAAAAVIAAAAFGRGSDPRRLLPCSPASDGDARCRERSIRELGRKLFRRPLDEREVARYSALFAREKRFYEGARIVAEAMLQSPSFLYAVESTPVAEYRPYARASRLAFFLWDSAPDDALLDAARRGELDTPGGFERVARAMLANPKAARSVEEFIAQWLRLDQVVVMLKERRVFPQFTRELALAMTEETRRLVGELVWNDRSFMELFTADYTFVNSDLAALYGLPAPSSGFERIPYSAGSERAGVLGHGSFLAVTSKPAETSPTSRGLFVREHFLCQKVPLPPPGVDMNLPPVTEKQPRTNRERLAGHTSNEMCAGCHRLIDPIGFGFEKFDALGARHDKMRIALPAAERRRGEPTPMLEIDVDTRGTIAGVEGAEFTSPRELGTILAANRQCQECVVKQLFRYAMGRAETPADRQALAEAADAFRRSQFRFKELMIAVARVAEFPPGSSRP